MRTPGREHGGQSARSFEPLTLTLTQTLTLTLTQTLTRVRTSTQVTTIRNLLWPGFVAFSGPSKKWGYCYFGTGEKNADIAFMLP